MTQYVSYKVTFGNAEFQKIFRGIVDKDKSIPRQIGAPCAFVFAPSGKTVYCGPPRQAGLAVNDEFRDIMISGVKEAKYLKPPVGDVSDIDYSSLDADKDAIRAALKDKNFPLAASTFVKYLPKKEEGAVPSGEMEKLSAMTGKVAGNAVLGHGLDPLLKRIRTEFESKYKAIIKSAEALSADPLVIASSLLELNHIYGEYPFAKPRTSKGAVLLIVRGIDRPTMEQAIEFAAAKYTELSSVDKAKRAYKKIKSQFKGSPVVELANARIEALESVEESSNNAEKASAPPAETKRTWTSKSGAFTVEATLISFDGKTAKLEKSDGKTIDVEATKLSAEDQKYLSTRKN